jgi:hypothetical protein
MARNLRPVSCGYTTISNDTAIMEISIPLLKSNGKAAGFIGAVCLLTFGSLVMVFSSVAVINAKRSLHWMPVSGKIVSADRHSPSDGSDFLMIKYDYKIGDAIYQGDKICFGMGSIGEKKISSVRAGQNITVFVNQKNAFECVLLPGEDGGSKVFLALGGLFDVLGLILAYFAFRGRRRVGPA